MSGQSELAMIATMDAFDEMVAEVARQATRSAYLATGNSHRYVDEVTAASHSQFEALSSFQKAVVHSVLELQNASSLLSRSILDVSTLLNRALTRWVTAAIWPWEPLVAWSEPEAAVQYAVAPEMDYDASQVGDCVMSALRFQGPMGMISSGMGELED